jgi:hypothetical protein
MQLATNNWQLATMPTALQIKLVQIARRQAGLEEGQYRTILRSVAGVDSCTKLSQEGFEDVMAVIESCGFTDRTHGAGYWQRKSGDGSRRVWKIHQLAEESRYELAALCRRFSGDRTDAVEQLLPREQWMLIEMLKAAAGRETRTTNGAKPEGSGGSRGTEAPQGCGSRAEARTGLFGLPAVSAVEP